MKKIIFMAAIFMAAVAAGAEPPIKQFDVVALGEQDATDSLKALEFLATYYVVQNVRTTDELKMAASEREKLTRITKGERAFIANYAIIPFMDGRATLKCWLVVLLDGEHAGKKLFIPMGTVVSVLFHTVP